jgi:predicted ATP-dependent serine protease
MRDYKVPCTTCGFQTTFNYTGRCNNCWEVERRLKEYLKSENGREFVRKLLAGGEPDQ